MVSFARLERAALVDTARSVGPTAPTLCAGWDVRDLVVHLLVRERRPWAAPAIFVPGLGGLERRASAGLSARPFEALLSQFSQPPMPLRVEALERAMNSVEFFVHHEDIRRAQPSWQPRKLSPEAEAELWRGLGLLGRVTGRRAGVPLVVTDGVRRVVLRRGEQPAVLTGPVSELVMAMTGRAQLEGLSRTGTPEQIEALERANLSL